MARKKLLTEDCAGNSGTCGVHYSIVDGVVYYNNYVVNSDIESYELKATRISDNKTVTLLKPNNSCSESCYNFKISGEDVINYPIYLINRTSSFKYQEKYTWARSLWSMHSVYK